MESARRQLGVNDVESKNAPRRSERPLPQPPLVYSRLIIIIIIIINYPSPPPVLLASVAVWLAVSRAVWAVVSLAVLVLCWPFCCWPSSGAVWLSWLPSQGCSPVKIRAPDARAASFPAGGRYSPTRVPAIEARGSEGGNVPAVVFSCDMYAFLL